MTAPPPTATVRRIRERRAGRDLAVGVLSIATPADLDQLGFEGRAAFWEAIRSAALEHAPLSAEGGATEAMPDDDAREFGKTEMRWGKHAGQRIDSVPLEYLIWLSDDSSTFSRLLRGYLASPRIKSEVEQLE